MDEENAAKVAELRKEHGKIRFAVVPDHGLFVFGKTANKRAYPLVVDAIRDPKKDVVTAQVNFILSCVKWPLLESGAPDLKAVRAMLDDNPVAPSELFNSCAALNGGDIEILGED